MSKRRTGAAFCKAWCNVALAGVELVISDAHVGLREACNAVLGGLPWQRCQCHLQRNAQAYVPKRDMKRGVAADIRAIFNAATRHDAETLLAQAVKKYAPQAAKLADWLETNIPEGLTVFSFPDTHRRRSARRTDWSGSTARFVAVHASLRYFLTKLHACDW